MYKISAWTASERYFSFIGSRMVLVCTSVRHCTLHKAKVQSFPNYTNFGHKEKHLIVYTYTTNITRALVTTNGSIYIGAVGMSTPKCMRLSGCVSTVHDLVNLAATTWPSWCSTDGIKRRCSFPIESDVGRVIEKWGLGAPSRAESAEQRTPEVS